jgi:hypothetical protein
MHVCCWVQQDLVGKDKISFHSYLYGFLELMIIEESSSSFFMNGLFYLYRYDRGAYPIPFYPLLQGLAFEVVTRPKRHHRFMLHIYSRIGHSHKRKFITIQKILYPYMHHCQIKPTERSKTTNQQSLLCLSSPKRSHHM